MAADSVTTEAKQTSSGAGDRTRFFPTAQLTFDSLFGEDGKFVDRDQLVEVPADQYEECLSSIQEAISDGKVSGEADKIIRKSEFSYHQVRRIAKSGKVVSLIWNEEDESISCDFEYAITFSVQFARGKWEGLSDDESIDEATTIGGENSFVAGWTELNPKLRHLASAAAMAGRVNFNRFASSRLGQSMVQRVATISIGRTASAGAMGHFAKIMRINAISALVLAIMVCIPDLLKAWKFRSISWRQFGKNSAKNAVGVFTGVAGWVLGMKTGEWFAAWLNAAPNGFWHYFSTYGFALIFGVVICLGFTELTRRLLDKKWDDDAKMMMKIVNEEIGKRAEDHVLTPSEGKQVVQTIQTYLKAKWLRQMWQAGSWAGDESEAETRRRDYAIRELNLEQLTTQVLEARIVIEMPDPSTVEEDLSEALAKMAKAKPATVEANIQ